MISHEEAQRLGIKGSSDDDPSGHALAEAAYTAGAVEPAVQLHTYDVTLQCVVVGSRESAEGIGAMLELEAETRDSVTETVLTVAERP